MTEFYEGVCKRHGRTKFYASRNCALCIRESKTSFCGLATDADAGQAGEHLVAADLLKRGLKGTKPLNINGPDDLHFKFSVGWKTIQVKLGAVNSNTGLLKSNKSRSDITSDILALVDLRGMRVRYVANVGPLPEELIEGENNGL